MEHYIKDNIYYIVDGDKELLRVELVTDITGNQVIIATENEIYAGPIALLSFSPDAHN